VFDEDLNKRLATEIKRRLRPARFIREFFPEKTPDPVVLRFVAEKFTDAVLVTGDDSMPWVHATTVAATSATIAVVSPCAPQDPNEDAYEREIVHKWAHRIHEQPSGTVMRYHLTGPVPWKPRKR
jgi:hypothetical protein